MTSTLELLGEGKSLEVVRLGLKEVRDKEEPH
jgi:hypothetical protein